MKTATKLALAAALTAGMNEMKPRSHSRWNAPQLAQYHPEGPVLAREPWPLALALKDAELLAQCCVLTRQSRFLHLQTA